MWTVTDKLCSRKEGSVEFKNTYVTEIEKILNRFLQ